MKKMIPWKKLIVPICIAILMPGLLGGCSYFSSPTAGADQNVKGASPQYYDFGDVLIPKELKVDKDESFIYKTTGFSAGVLVLAARVERNSLISFFESNMVKDGWRVISSFKSPRTMMLFHKENRWCVINITDRSLDYKVHVEIWVSPTMSEIESGVFDESGILK